MIRLIQRRLIIPRGDTGSFSIPVLKKGGTDNIAVFTIFDVLTRTKMFQKEVASEGDSIVIAFTHNDTVNLKPGKYVWDIKYYSDPVYADEELVNGSEIDSYYAGYTLPVCEIRETADNYLVSPDGPTSTLSPEQLDIITSAINSLNNAIEKTQENVEHYPEIRDEVWYVWDAEEGDYVSTGVRANGIVGNGIASAVLNNDYTLTLNFTDGTSFTSPSIRGQKGNGIDDIVLNNDFTLTISYTDGDSYTTPSIRGPIGLTPQFSIGTVQDGAVAAASITGTAENPVLNLTLPNAHVPTRVSQLENDSNYAVDANYVHTDNNYTTAEKNKLSGIAAGAEVNVNADWNASSGDAQILNKPTNVSAFTNDAGYLTSYTETDPTVPEWAKAAQKPTYTAAEVGAPTVQEMNTAIGTAIGNINSFDMAVVQTLPNQNISTHTIYLVPKTGETNDVYDEYVYINNNWEMVGNTQIDLSDYALKSELPTKVSDLTDDSGHYTKPSIGIPASDLADGVIPDVPVQDVQVDGTSVLNNGVANMPVASSSELGVIKIGAGLRLAQNGSNQLLLQVATSGDIRNSNNTNAVTGSSASSAAFYGLARAAGDTTQQGIAGNVGSYTDSAKSAIQSMLGISQMLAPTNPNLIASQAYSIGDVFAANGKLYKATAAIAQDGAIIPDTNCVETTMVDAGGKIKDVQVAGSSVVGSDGVANVPIAGINHLGAVKAAGPTFGVNINANGQLSAACVGFSEIKQLGGNAYKPLPSGYLKEAVFYGMAGAAGDATQSASSNAVGNYTDAAKSAISEMLSGSVAVTGTTPTITALPGIRYVCGECMTLNITLPASGIVDVVFESGSTPTVLTITPPTGVTVKWANGFDPDNLEANTTYEINIADGLGVAASWT